MSDLIFSAGEVIFKELYPSDHAYIIKRGKVEIYRTHPDGTEESLAMLSRGEMFGEYGVLDDKPRSASARAIEDTELQIMDI